MNAKRRGLDSNTRRVRLLIGAALVAGVVLLGMVEGYQGVHGSPRLSAGATFVQPAGPATRTVAAPGQSLKPLTARSGIPRIGKPLTPVQSSPHGKCRKNPLAGVYHPWRLHINRPCITVSGTVERVRTEPDHDWHINLLLPPAYHTLINAENRKWEHGDLVVEVIPMDQQRVARLSVGEHITVTGAFVLDADHGWEEIHPAWYIDGAGSVHYTEQEAARSVESGIRGNKRYFGKRR